MYITSFPWLYQDEEMHILVKGAMALEPPNEAVRPCLSHGEAVAVSRTDQSGPEGKASGRPWTFQDLPSDLFRIGK